MNLGSKESSARCRRPATSQLAQGSSLLPFGSSLPKMGTLKTRKVALSAVLMAGGFALFGCNDDAGAGSDECRYDNGRTYMEEVNHCNTMRDQGVQCTVPPPPVC